MNSHKKKCKKQDPDYDQDLINRLKAERQREEAELRQLIEEKRKEEELNAKEEAEELEELRKQNEANESELRR